MAIDIIHLDKNSAQDMGILLIPGQKDRDMVDGLSVKKIPRSERDKIKKNVIVKPWGHEHICFENKHIDAWEFLLNPSFATSFHCHPKKDTIKIVLEGEVFFETAEGKFILKTGDTKLIKGGLLHKTTNLSDKAARVLEMESPPDKTHLIRVADSFGRENSPYASGTNGTGYWRDILVKSYFQSGGEKIHAGATRFILSPGTPKDPRNSHAKQILGIRLAEWSEKLIPVRSLTDKDASFVLVAKGKISITDGSRASDASAGNLYFLSGKESFRPLLCETDLIIW